MSLKQVEVSQQSAAACATSEKPDGSGTQPFGGLGQYLAQAQTGGAAVIGKIWRQDWTEQQWLEHFKELEQFPEAAKAMKLYNSKLYQVMK